MCSGEWNDDWTEQLTTDYCIPSKVGDCQNHCPTKCGKDEVVCPGQKEYDGCQSPDFCASGKFCPAQCNSEEVACSGEWNDDCPDCEKLTADYCIPSKVGDCWNSCPTHCPKDDLICPGKINPDG